MSLLESKLNTLPAKPGVYLYKNAAGEIIYVGKAKNLRARVRSYFIKSSGRETRTEMMIAEIADLDYFLVSNEVESLILENNLIKQYQPRYNILLRDDKNYQFIKIDYASAIPQIYPVRKLGSRAQAKYFGPYTSGLAVRRTLKLIENVFHLCRNKKITSRPCFAYHLKRCPGVCVGEISLSQYRHQMKEIGDFLRHKQGAVIADLKHDMKQAAREKNFEYAALLRDKLRALLSIWERQKVISPKKENEDYLGLYTAPTEAVVNVFLVREGKLLNQEHFTLTHDSAPAGEILERFIVQYYQDSSDIPKNIFLPGRIENSDIVEAALGKLRKAKVKIAVPVRGRKGKLMQLAGENARAYYERERATFEKEDETKILEELKRLLNLPKLPERIEAFDISNMQGTHPVGSMIVFTQGRPDKSQYRKFKINIKETPDDVAMMREMLERRFGHISTPLPSSLHLLERGVPSPGDGEGERERSKTWPTPDLIIIDGGRGQLNAAEAAIPNSQFPIPKIALAKRLEEIYLSQKKQPIRLPQNSLVLHLLQRLRDEAHRFAATFHRGRRGRAMVRSRLDEIPGIGPVLKKKLLKKFGSAAEIKKTSHDEIAEVIGEAKAKILKEQI